MISTKYATVYPYDNANDAMNNNYEKNTKIYGDAIRETSTNGFENYSWYSEESKYPNSIAPFIRRGGRLWDYMTVGKFNYNVTDGSSHYSHGFRVTLCAK